MKFIVVKLPLLGLLFLLTAPHVFGQSVHFLIDNDYPFSDYDYSSGLHMAYDFSSEEKPDATWNIGLGYQLYTPRNLVLPTLIPQDRPYAAWIGITGMRLQKIEKQLVVLGFRLGVVGPMASGQSLQNWIHWVGSFQRANGWSNQLPNEPTLDLFAQSRNRLYEVMAEDARRVFELSANYGAALGNAFTYFGGEAQLRAGYRIPEDFGPTIGYPIYSPAVSVFPDHFWIAGFARVETRFMVRNLYLQGTWFNPSHSVDRRHLLWGAQLGIQAGYKALEISTYVAIKSPETNLHSPYFKYANFQLGVSF